MIYAEGPTVYHIAVEIIASDGGVVWVEECTERWIHGPTYQPEHGNEEGAPDWFRTKRLCRSCLRRAST